MPQLLALSPLAWMGESRSLAANPPMNSFDHNVTACYLSR